MAEIKCCSLLKRQGAMIFLDMNRCFFVLCFGSFFCYFLLTEEAGLMSLHWRIPSRPPFIELVYVRGYST